MTTAYARALAQIEERLGSPRGEGPFGHREALIRDEAESFPTDALSALGRLGLPEMLAPPEEGGAFTSFDQVVALAWSLARRDPALALTVGMQSWLWLLWMAGTPEQRALGQAMMRNNAAPCFAASEAEHGADLLANDALALARTGSWQVTGEKWPIGLAGRARHGFVLARTRSTKGPRALSWFLLDLNQSAVARLPRPRTHGMRAADLGGLRLERASAELVGDEGQGLELALKVFQITRPLMASIGLGTAETAIRIATEFAHDRALYGGRGTDLGAVRRELVEAWLGFIAAEILLLSTARALHVRPQQASLLSPLSKAIAPELLARSIQGATTVLGARSFLRDGATGIFQKMVRDHAAVSLIDGSTPVCLHALFAELAPERLADDSGERFLANRFDLALPLPAFRHDSLELTSRGADDVIGALPDELRRPWADWRRRFECLGTAQRLTTAQRYGQLHAAACCLHFGHFNPELSLIKVGISTLAARLLIDRNELDQMDAQPIFELLLDRVARGTSLSVVGGPSDGPIKDDGRRGET